MADLKTMQDLLHHELQVLYSGEKLIVAGLPRMIQHATNAELKQAFAQHLEETKRQAERLEQIAQMLNINPQGDGNPSLKGLIAEGEKVMHKDADPDVLDATLIASAQKIEHYEIAGYGTARYLAQMLGQAQVAQLLSQTLEEEKKTDTILNNLAISKINQNAPQV
jgi:ferritin-like metal-binding protein YciE